MEIVQKPENKNVKLAIWLFTIVVYALVVSLHYIPKPQTAPNFSKALPLLNACINGTCFLLLIASLIVIKQKKVALHMRLNTIAMILSVFFLLSYVLYHVTNGDTPYAGTQKGLYYFVLLSHIVLAGVSLPMILLAYYKAWTGNIQAHRKIVKFTYPIWLYVTLTGVLVYLFLMPYYQ